MSNENQTDKVQNQEEKLLKVEHEKMNNRDIDLVKIQIYADRSHAVLTSALSFIFVFFSLVGIFYGILYQNISFTSFATFLTAYNTWAVGTFTIISVTIVFLYSVRRSYLRDLTRISDMINAVKSGEELPSLVDELTKKKKIANDRK